MSVRESIRGRTRISTQGRRKFDVRSLGAGKRDKGQEGGGD